MTQDRLISLLSDARRPSPLERYAANLIDEFVDGSLATRLFTISDTKLLQAPRPRKRAWASCG